MLEQLFPKYHRRYAASPHARELRAFARWLDKVGYGRDPAHDHVRRLREALDRRRRPLDAPIDRAGVDSLFAELPDNALYRATRRAFSRFLEACGRLLAEPDQRPHGKSPRTPVLASIDATRASCADARSRIWIRSGAKPPEVRA